MDELDHRGQVETLLALIAEGARHEQEQGRPQALPASRDDVLGHMAYQRNAGVESAGDHAVDPGHVFGDEAEDVGGRGVIGGGN
ncbi:hypothetical protein GCM10023165_22290 [Variovorax defluvii]|uniref:DUF664 domain-containing protein n=1 Tax=Variovorax defluvii TaxID=913761 RepID=A0ABP8HMV9_9BURK